MHRSLVLVAALTIACGDTSNNNGGGDQSASVSDMSMPSGNDGATGPIATPTDFCNDFVGAIVAKLQSCCSATDQMDQGYQFALALLQFVQVACGQDLSRAVQSGRATFDAGQAQQCITLVEAALSSCSMATGILGSGMMPTSGPCATFLVGKQAAGMPCRGDAECQSGLTCVGFTANGDGSCTSPPAVGQPCGGAVVDGGTGATVDISFGNHPHCASGAYCPRAEGETCQMRGAAGASCAVTPECADGLSCIMNQCSTSAPGMAGAACTSDGDCQGTFYCGSDGKCAARKTAGTACSGTSTRECLGRCVLPDGGTAGTCASFCMSG